MIKHYKRLGICLGILLLSAIAVYFLRPHLFLRIDYQPIINRYAKEYDLEPALVCAVIKTESNFDPDAKSDKDAHGLMQITEPTLNWAIFRENQNADYTVKDLYDPDTNIKYGCLILSLLINEFEDRDTALAAYNAGRGNTIKWLKDRRYSDDGIHIKDTPYQETDEYIKRVNKYYLQYQEKLGESQ